VRLFVSRPSLENGGVEPNRGEIPFTLYRRPQRIKPHCCRIEEHGAGYDIVVIDCPPQLGKLLTAALYASDNVLVPCAADAMGLQGLADLWKAGELRLPNWIAFNLLPLLDLSSSRRPRVLPARSRATTSEPRCLRSAHIGRRLCRISGMLPVRPR
jgi:hypothetical protein